LIAVRVWIDGAAPIVAEVRTARVSIQVEGLAGDC
jgi:hypothetical protein